MSFCFGRHDLSCHWLRNDIYWIRKILQTPYLIVRTLTPRAATTSQSHLLFSNIFSVLLFTIHPPPSIEYVTHPLQCIRLGHRRWNSPKSMNSSRWHKTWPETHLTEKQLELWFSQLLLSISCFAFRYRNHLVVFLMSIKCHILLKFPLIYG